jgi:NADH dehydrogenase
MSEPEASPVPQPEVPPQEAPPVQPAEATQPAEPPPPPRIIAVMGEIPFCGSAICRVLLEKGFSVRVLCPDEQTASALPRASGSPDPATLEIVRGSLETPESIVQVLQGAYGAVFVSPITLKGRMYRANEHLDDVRRVVEAIRKSELKRFVYHSSVSAHPNSQSRALGQAAEAEGIVTSLKCQVLRARSSVLMGRGDQFLTELIERAQGASPVMGILGYGSTMVQPIHVDDMARCVSALFEDSTIASGVINIAGPEITTPMDLIDSVLDGMGRFKLKFHAPLFILKLLTSLGVSAEFKEKINLLFEIFCTDNNDSVKLLGARKLMTPRESQEEILGVA